MLIQSRDVMKDTFETMLCAARILWIVSALLPASFAQTASEITDNKSQQPSDVVCMGIEVRNYITEIRKYENCTVVEGHVAIFLIDLDTAAAYETVSLPRLREITDYLLLYHAQNMKTLSNIFPNLSVIRGRKLFYHYAIVVFEMRSLDNLGLRSLTLIERGAIYAENNPQLCYLDTIDWGRIMTLKEENRFSRNKNPEECFNMYPEISYGNPMANTAVGTGPRCWNYNILQKICPSTCLSNACYETEVNEPKKCCHTECVGGCSGPTNADCFACKAIKYNGRCQRNCPPGLYEINGWRCVDEMECKRFQASGERRKWVTFEEGDKALCLKECPLGYTAGVNASSHRCVRCSGPCPKICHGRILDSLQAAETLDGCTIINGSLEVQLAGGNVAELEKFLGQIQEVTYFLRIVNSIAITSLSFLKSLRVIRGDRLYARNYSLFIHYNRNLDDIWDLENHPNLTIDQGNVLFLDNPKLCLYKIHNFLAVTDVRNQTEKIDLSISTNGDLAACHIYDLALRIDNTDSTWAKISWTEFSIRDVRYHIGWVVSYRQVPDDTVITMHTGKEVCGDDVWISIDVSPESRSLIIKDLQPFTKYAVYVKAYVMPGVTRGAISPLVDFRTKMSAPSHVRKLSVETKGTHDLRLTWIEPEMPNGNITHYVVTWSIINEDEAAFEKRNYCVERLRQRYDVKDSKTSPDKNPSLVAVAPGLNKKCCQCPKNQQQLDLEQRKRQFDIALENHIHNFVYVKHEPGISSRVINKRDVEASKKRAVATKTGIESTSAPSPSAASMTAALGITSSTNGNLVSVTEETQTSRRHRQMSNVTGNTSIVLSGLMHFQQYNIEVVACQGANVNDSEKLCSMPTILGARTNPDNNADNIDTETVTITRDQNDTYLMQWSSPPIPNAIILTFEIELSRVDTENYKPDVRCITYKAFRELNGTRFSRVMSWGNWSYRVRAMSLAGNGSWTSVQHFFIESPEPSSNNLQHLLGTLAVIPLLAILVAVISYAVIRYKRQFVFPDVISYNPEYINPEDLYISDEWEVKREQVTLLEALGQGSFGMVYRGLFRDSDGEDKESVEVAIKTVMETSTLRDRIAFLHEASVMKAFDSYHVVKLLGIVSKGQPSLVVMELMSNGDLKTFLRKHRDDMENEKMLPPPLQLILQMAGEIADGMAYLSSKKFVHRDLAARNCMVSSDLTVKIGDFGLTRDIYATDYYRKNTKGLLPVRWMAPESLKDGVFTLHSDIWSYGIVLWEMATLATQPYQGLSNEEVLHYVIDGGKMIIPEKCPEKLVNLMSMCWDSTPKKRPSFEDVIEILLPDLNSNFSVVSYYFTRNGEEELDDIHDKEEEEERAEEEEENSKTPLSISFAPVRSGSQTTGKHEAAIPNGFNPCLGLAANCEPNITKSRFEPFEADDDLSRSSSYPRLQYSHEGLSNSRHGDQIRNSVKSAVNLLTSLATSSRPGIVHKTDVKRSAPDQRQHQLVSL